MTHASLITHAIIPIGLLGACQCTDRANGFDEGQSRGVDDDPSSSTDATTEHDDATSMEPGETTEGIDASRFIGVFHFQPRTVPIGEAVPPTGGEAVLNVDIRPDGTATMTYETCAQHYGTQVTELRWQALSETWIELMPGAGQPGMQYMAVDEIDTLRATLVDDCTMYFELDGVLLVRHVYRPGRTCWVNRCENPPWMVHIDYCEGEPPPLCE